MVLEHSFGDALFVQAAALLFGLVALALLGRQLWKRSELPAWQHVLSTMGIAASGLLCLLAAHDCVTKVAFIRLETEPVRLTYERAFPARRTSLEPGELRAVGLLHLGAPLRHRGRFFARLSLPLLLQACGFALISAASDFAESCDGCARVWPLRH